jgi:hypothetical protein
MGEKGIGTFIKAEKDGLYVQFSSHASPRFVYIGPELTSEMAPLCDLTK